MAFDDVYLVSEKLVLPPTAELDALQGWLAAPLPRGYREYMTTLGVGTYCDRVGVLALAEVREVRDERREYVREYYEAFWGESEDYLTLEEAVGGVYFARTADGDEIYYLPDSERLFVLLRHDDVVYWLGTGFEDPLDWRSPTGQMNDVHPPFRQASLTPRPRLSLGVEAALYSLEVTGLQKTT